MTSANPPAVVTGSVAPEHRSTKPGVGSSNLPGRTPSGKTEELAGPRRESPGAKALREHAQLCRHCDAVGRAGKPATQFCGAGYVLFLAAKRARARRTVLA